MFEEEEVEDEDDYFLNILFDEPLGGYKSSVQSCNEQIMSGVADNEENDLIYQPIFPGDIKEENTTLASLKNGKKCIIQI